MLLSTLQASALSVVMLAAVYWPLERLWPARRQPWLRPRLGTDFLFLFGQHLVWSVLALAFLGVVDGLVRASLPLGVRAGFLGLPLPAQLVAIVLLGDGAVYWFHRACHRFDFLWRFHAVHHSSQTLDWVAAHREHPVDGLLTQLTINLPAILLGFPVEGLAALAVFRGLWATFIHSNVRVPLGPLKYVLGAPELHHWHHAKAPGVVANYGNLSPWTDLLFGTFHLPPAGEETWELGVPQRLPESWAGLLVSPFTRAWADSAELLRARALGPVMLAALVAITFGGVMAHAQPSGAAAADAGAPDAGARTLKDVFGSGDYLPASKSFGGVGVSGGQGDLGGLRGLGLRGRGSEGSTGMVGLGLDRRRGALETKAAEVTVTGSLSKDVVRRVMLQHRGAFGGCHEAQLRDGGVIAGKVVLEFVIAATGQVTSPTVAQSTVRHAALEACLLERLARVVFPAPQGGGAVQVTYPFDFSLARERP